MIVIDLGYRSFVMDNKDAVMLAEVLAKAEVFEKKYWREEDRKRMGMEDTYTYHVYDQPVKNAGFPMQIIADSLYRMAK